MRSSRSWQLEVSTRLYLSKAEVMRPRYVECMSAARDALKETANMSMKQPGRFSEIVLHDVVGGTRD